MKQTQASLDVVVLVPGLWLGGWSMALLGHWLRRAGWQPYAFTYPTVRYTLRQSAAALHAFSEQLAGNTIHYVGHSLGGIVIRALFAYQLPTRPGRIVTLGSPHNGCRAGQLLCRRDWGRRISGLSIADLLRDELPHTVAQRDVGVIKGGRSFGLGRMLFDLPQPNDGVVCADEADLAGAADSITLPVAHSQMLVSHEVARQTDEFLRHGRFAHSSV